MVPQECLDAAKRSIGVTESLEENVLVLFIFSRRQLWGVDETQCLRSRCMGWIHADRSPVSDVAAGIALLSSWCVAEEVGEPDL